MYVNAGMYLWQDETSCGSLELDYLENFILSKVAARS